MKRAIFIIATLPILLTGCVTRGNIRGVDKDDSKVVVINDIPAFPAGDVTNDRQIEIITPAIETTTERVKGTPVDRKQITIEQQMITMERVRVTAERKVEKPAPIPKKTRKMENKAFAAGEKLTFALQYLGITAGTAVIDVKELVNLNGNKTYHIVTTTRSLPIFDPVAKVNDNVESFIDFDGLFSRRLIKTLQEGNYSRDVTLDYDQDRNTVREVEKSGEKVYNNIPDYCQDILSAFYYFRAQKVEVGKDLTVDVYADGKCHKLQVQVLRKEIVKIPLGRYEAFVVKPFMEFESVFKQEGDVTVWVSTDERHIPLLMKSRVFVSSVNAKLIDASIAK
jgi:hypothetical protein